MPLAALAVHEGRYYLAFGARTPARLLHDGHGYLGSLVPFIVLAAALALGLFAGRLARAWQGIEGIEGIADVAPATTRRRHSTGRIWAVCAATLIALYCGQELAEGALAAGHAGGLAGIAGSGGWLAVPLAILAGGALTLMLRAGDALTEMLAGRRHARPAPAPPRVSLGRRRPPLRSDWRLAGASGVSAGRAPPLSFGHR